MKRPALFITAFAVVHGVGSGLIAQPESNASTPAASTNDDSFEHGMRLLSNVRDNVLSFDDPAFYWFCRYVNTPAGMSALEGAAGSSPANGEPSNSSIHAAPTPIKFLLERPGDYRGRPVTIEGTLVAKWSWSVDNRDVPNPLNQCEIAVAGTRALAAVVTTGPVDHVPIRSSVRATGFFIKVRAFQTTGGESGFGPLLVARNLTPVAKIAESDPSTFSGAPRSAQYLILSLTAFAAFVWLALRRIARRPVAPTLHRPGAAPHAESPDDFDWMLEEREK